MQSWYNKITSNQRKLLWVCSTGLILFFGTGLLTTAVLLFLEFGRRNI